MDTSYLKWSMFDHHDNWRFVRLLGMTSNGNPTRSSFRDHPQPWRFENHLLTTHPPFTSPQLLLRETENSRSSVCEVLGYEK